MITKKLAKAILLSPKEGTIIDLDEISWVSHPSPLGEKVDIYVNDVRVVTCDLSFIREYANS
jgi:flagellar motor switch/type III secretory pathway protein FliN